MGLKFNKWEPNKTIVRAASFGCLRTAWHAGKGGPTHVVRSTRPVVLQRRPCSSINASSRPIRSRVPATRAAAQGATCCGKCGGSFKRQLVLRNPMQVWERFKTLYGSILQEQTTLLFSFLFFSFLHYIYGKKNRKKMLESGSIE